MKLTMQECDDLLEAIDTAVGESMVPNRPYLDRLAKLQQRLRNAKNSLHHFERAKP